MNCSQIFCTFAVETTLLRADETTNRLWIALKFFVLLQSKQQMLYLCSVNQCCELLSNFLYFCSRNNLTCCTFIMKAVVNCSQIFCTFAVETTLALVVCTHVRCELLSNFLYFCSRNNRYLPLLYRWPLWIALKFFVLLQSKQPDIALNLPPFSCELLSNFLYFCSRNNGFANTFRA